MESKKAAAPVLSEAQQKKSINGSTKVQKRKVLLNTLDSPLDLDWYFNFFKLRSSVQFNDSFFRPRIGAQNEAEVTKLLAEYIVESLQKL